MQSGTKPHKAPSIHHICLILQRGNGAQRGRVTCPKSHSQKSQRFLVANFNQGRTEEGIIQDPSEGGKGPTMEGRWGEERACLLSSLLGHIHQSICSLLTIHSWTLSTCWCLCWALRTQVNQAHLCSHRAHGLAEQKGKLGKEEAATCLGVLVFTEGLLWARPSAGN